MTTAAVKRADTHSRSLPCNRDNIPPSECCILNSGRGSWAFEPLAFELSACLRIDVSNTPRRFNYLLHVEDQDRLDEMQLFIPLSSIRLASDKRLLATRFLENEVPTPETHLVASFDEVRRFIREHPDREWCLKYPIGCGAAGHRLINEGSVKPGNWPRPFILQAFIRMEQPEVYRVFCAGGELFGWVVRRFPRNAQPSPWVSHAHGAHYIPTDEPSKNAVDAARRALVAVGLWDTFGCVDLLCSPEGEWMVLEVGTDGLFSHVDRDLGDPGLTRELNERLARAFWRAAARAT